MNHINNEALIESLQHKVLEVTFNKTNGERRVMTCTLMPSRLPELNRAPIDTTSNSATVSVWDLEVNGWRSFRHDSVLSVREVV